VFVRGSRVGGGAESVAAVIVDAPVPGRAVGGEVAGAIEPCGAPASTFDTAPIVGIEEALRLSTEEDDAGAARTQQARSHEAAAEVLADRGEWRRAYHHLRAAMALVHLGDAPPIQVPEQLRREVDRLRRERAEARDQSRRDSLTATWNRRYLDERLATLCDSAPDDSAPDAACVALVDVDHFKLVNDTHGHAVGDEVLRTLVELMRGGVEDAAPEGFCARYGGEEFALVLSGAGPDDAVVACEGIRARIQAHDWSELAPDLRVTVSIGLGRLPLERVDELLYVAKRTGRNAVAFRDAAGRVRLAGAASGRRGIEAVARAVCSTA
jgi:diguanylate cyclase (GGDEF)-like protein